MDCENGMKDVMNYCISPNDQNNEIENHNENWLMDCEVADFESRKINMKKLKAFCHVRKYNSATIKKKENDIPSRKKELADMAFKICLESVKLKRPTNAEEILAASQTILSNGKTLSDNSNENGTQKDNE